MRLTLMLFVVVAALAVVAWMGWSGAGRASSSLESTLAQMATLRASMQADMMHDALRADVLLAFRLGASDTRGTEAEVAGLRSDVTNHAASFEESLGHIQTLGTPAAQAEAGRVEPLVRRYLDSARTLSATAVAPSTQSRSDQADYDAFMADFRALEEGMEALGDVIPVSYTHLTLPTIYSV